jgi:hypothetical protein
MGVAISTVALFFGAVVAGILSIVAGTKGAREEWSKAEMWSAISAALSLILLVGTLIFVVVMRTNPAGEVVSLFESFGVGVMLAYILLMAALLGGVAGNIFGIMYSSQKDKKKLEISTIVTGVSLILAAIFSLVPIVFLI